MNSQRRGEDSADPDCEPYLRISPVAELENLREYSYIDTDVSGTDLTSDASLLNEVADQSEFNLSLVPEPGTTTILSVCEDSQGEGV